MQPESPPRPRRLRHIAVEGAIGVGKTAVALRVARWLDAETLLEQADDNPFLERFYGDREGYAFQTQLFFLFQRLAQVRTLAQPGMFAHCVVSDFTFAKDAIYARVNLSDEEYHHYAQIHARLAPQLPQPDLVIWLQADGPALHERIRERGIAAQRRIGEAYLRKLAAAYAAHFGAYAGAPVLAVDGARCHPGANDADFANLAARIDALREGLPDPGAAEGGVQPLRF